MGVSGRPLTGLTKEFVHPGDYGVHCIESVEAVNGLQTVAVSSENIRCGAVSGLHIVAVSSDGEFDGTNLEAVSGLRFATVSSKMWSKYLCVRCQRPSKHGRFELFVAYVATHRCCQRPTNSDRFERALIACYEACCCQRPSTRDRFER